MRYVRFSILVGDPEIRKEIWAASAEREVGLSMIYTKPIQEIDEIKTDSKGWIIVRRGGFRKDL